MSVAFSKYMSKFPQESAPTPKQKGFQVPIPNPQVLRKYDMSSSSLNLKPKQNFTINISPRQPEKFLGNEKAFEHEKKAINNSEKKYFQEKNEKTDKCFKLSNEKTSYDAYDVDKNENKFNFGIEKPEKKTTNPEKTLRCVIDENRPRKPLTLTKTASERKPDQNQENNNKIDELANLRHQKRSNTQFIDDMKTNISMQFEKLKEFKVTRTNFQRVLQEKENELDLNLKERTVFDENDYRINYSQDKLPTDYQKLQVLQNDYKINLTQEKNKQNDYKNNNKQFEYKNNLQEQHQSDNKSNYSQSDYKNGRQTEQEKPCQYKNVKEYDNNFTQEKQKEGKNNYTEEKRSLYKNNYTEEKQTIRKEARKDDEIMNYRKKYTEETAGNNKYSKSISCHFFNKKGNAAEEEVDDGNEGKISNKFSSNKTSSYLYGQMKIQEKRTEIDEKVMILKQNINRAKNDGNTQIKEIYKLFEELNECYQSLNEMSENLIKIRNHS